MKILVVNGANIDKIGARESMYGAESLQSLNNRLSTYAKDKGIEIDFFQSNIEGEIINRIAKSDFDGLIINAGGYTHYSVAIADALSCLGAAAVEVHITNILAREEYRQKSVLAKYTDGCITGLGVQGYFLAVDYLLWKICPTK